MYYIIKLNKLQKIISENINWEDNGKYEYIESSLPINQERLKSYVDLGKVGLNDNAGVQDNIYKLAAELVINNIPQQEMVVINLGDERGLPEKIFKDWKSVAQYFASSYLKEEDILCEITGKESIIKALLGSNIKQADDINKITNYKNKITEISWIIPEEMFAQSWGDENYILQQLNKSKDITKTYSFIPEHMWNNHEFITKILGDRTFDSRILLLPEEIKLGNNFFNYSLKNLKAFNQMWSTYKTYFDLEEKKNEYNTFTKQIELIKKEIFQDKEKCLELIKIRNKGIFQYFSKEIKQDKEIVDELYYKIVSEDYNCERIQNYIPQEYFSNKEKTINFILDYIDSVFNGGHTNISNKIPEYISNVFSDDEEQSLLILEKIKMIKSNKEIKTIIKNFKSNLSSEVLYSENILKKLIELKDYSIIENKKHMSMIEKNNHLLNSILENKNYKLFSCLNEKIIFSLIDKKDIIEIININYHFLKNENTPQQWLEDIDIVTAAGSSIDRLELTKTQIKKLATNPENTKRLIDCDKIIIKDLPKNMRLNIEVAKHIIEKLKITHDSMKKITINGEIDASLWANYSFCIHSLKVDYKLAENIPINYFNRPEFIKQIFKLLDEEEINQEIISYMPKEIKQCVDSFNIEIGEYTNFIDRFFNQQKLKQNLLEKTDIRNKKIKI